MADQDKRDVSLLLPATTDKYAPSSLFLTITGSARQFRLSTGRVISTRIMFSRATGREVLFVSIHVCKIISNTSRSRSKSF